jgi:hypothetical protein
MFCLFCYEICKTLTFCVSTDVESNLLFLFSFYNVVWHNILGPICYSIRVFRLQKRILRIMMGCKNRDSCRNLFINLKILPLPSQYIFCLLLFVVKNRELISTNNEIHPFGTRQHQNLH